MPRYFFHTTGALGVHDREGSELDDRVAACAQAATLVGEILRDQSSRFWGDPAWRLEVLDEAGEEVCAIGVEGRRWDG